MRALPIALLLPLPALAQDRPDPMILVEPTPRLPCSGTEPACKINAALLALDQQALTLPCPALDAAAAEAQGLDPGRDPLQPYYAHYVDVTFHGQDFYSLRLQNFGACPGEARGWDNATAVTFDLATGARIEPLTLLPAPLTAPSPEGQLTGLAKLYLQRLQAEDPEGHASCATALATALARPQPFLAWPEAAGLTLLPRHLAEAERACRLPLTLPADLLQSLGADPRLVADLAR